MESEQNPIYHRLAELLRALADEEVDYVLIGGLALNLQGIVRTTEDVDLFLRPDEENIERAKRALRRVWDDPAVEEIAAADLLGDYAVVRYGPPDEDVIVDLLTRIGTAVSFEDLESETKIYEGIPVQVATPKTLVRLKSDTIRPRDHADAAALRERFGID
jgi:predicted nucleotidyltransferase